MEGDKQVANNTVSYNKKNVEKKQGDEISWAWGEVQQSDMGRLLGRGTWTKQNMQMNWEIGIDIIH